MSRVGRPYTVPTSGGFETTFPFVPGRRFDRAADQISELNNLLSDHWQDIHDITDPRLRKHWKQAQVALSRISSRLRWMADQVRKA